VKSVICGAYLLINCGVPRDQAAPASGGAIRRIDAAEARLA
jgi:hypothetical protein